MSQYQSITEFFRTEKLYLTNDLRGLNKGFATSVSCSQDGRDSQIFVEFENGDISPIDEVWENNQETDIHSIINQIKRAAAKMVEDAEKLI